MSHKYTFNSALVLFYKFEYNNHINVNLAELYVKYVYSYKLYINSLLVVSSLSYVYVSTPLIYQVILTSYCNLELS